MLIEREEDGTSPVPGSRLFKIQISFARFSEKYFAAKSCYGDWKVLANCVLDELLVEKDGNVYSVFTIFKRSYESFGIPLSLFYIYRGKVWKRGNICLKYV